ncbi:MAG: hypothetical protein PHE73_03535 [Sulfurovaceae bacterium]|nr:hypothetical protein [Sulfurovaceae bacterium]
MTVILHDGYFIGTWLAREFGLPTNYFSIINSKAPKTLHREIDVAMFAGLVFVKLPSKVVEYIRAGYITAKIEPDDDLNMYEYILEITINTKIGFWI